MFQALPPTVESRCEVKRLHAQLTGAHTDAEYGIDHIKVDILVRQTARKMEKYYTYMYIYYQTDSPMFIVKQRRKKYFITK